MILAKHVKEIHKQLKKSGYTVNEVQSKEVYDIVVNTIIDNIGQGKRISIVNFGTFSSNLRLMNNPKDVSQKVTRWVVRFNCAMFLKKLLNGSEQNVT